MSAVPGINGFMLKANQVKQCRSKEKRITCSETDTNPFQPGSLPVLFLLIEVGYDVQQPANKGVGSRRAGRALAWCLRGEHGTAPLCVGQLLLHLHIFLPEQGEVLLQLGHLLCPTLKGKGNKQEDKSKTQGNKWEIRKTHFWMQVRTWPYEEFNPFDPKKSFDMQQLLLVIFFKYLQ